MMTSAQVVETSVNVTSNSPSQDYTHPDDHNLPNYGFTSLGIEEQALEQKTLQFLNILIRSHELSTSASYLSIKYSQFTLLSPPDGGRHATKSSIWKTIDVKTFDIYVFYFHRICL